MLTYTATETVSSSSTMMFVMALCTRPRIDEPARNRAEISTVMTSELTKRAFFPMFQERRPTRITSRPKRMPSAIRNAGGRIFMRSMEKNAQTAVSANTAVTITPGRCGFSSQKLFPLLLRD